jgi:hypothetical protein
MYWSYDTVTVTVGAPWAGARCITTRGTLCGSTPTTGLAKRVNKHNWIISKCPKCPAPSLLTDWDLSLFLPSPFPCHDPPGCSPPLSHSSSSLPASVSTPRPTRPPSSLPMPPLRHSKDRQGPTSVGRPLTRPRHARTPTVSARHA